MIGIFYMIYQPCIFTCMTVSMPKSALSLGYGISSSAQQVLGTIFPIFIGKISTGRTEESYGNVLTMMKYYSCVCLVFVVIINVLDQRDKGMLNLKDKSELLGLLRARIEDRFVKNTSSYIKQGADKLPDEEE